GSRRTYAVAFPKAGDEVRRVERGRIDRKDDAVSEDAYETVLGWWLAKTGQPALAARVLLPLLERSEQDDDLVHALCEDLAGECAERLFEAFATGRDYKEALRLARRMERYPPTTYRAWARRLLDELPRRMDDFTEMKLPTPAEWRRLRKGLTRAEQI